MKRMLKLKAEKNKSRHPSSNTRTDQPVSSSLFRFCRVIMQSTVSISPTPGRVTWPDCSRCPGQDRCPVYKPQTRCVIPCKCPTPIPTGSVGIPTFHQQVLPIEREYKENEGKSLLNDL